MSEQYVGEIRMVAFNFAPVGWALCNGQVLPIAQNEALFSLLGTTYGGNGTSNFQLPNLQSRVPVCAGQGLGLTVYTLGELGGQEAVTLSQAQMPTHTHVAVFNPNSTPPLSVNVTLNASTGPGNTVAASGASLAGYPGGGIPHSNGMYTTTPGTTAPVSGIAATLNGSGSVTNSAAGGGLPTPILQPFLVLNYIIALQGIYPTRS
jgi:microcystin-dependent protein